MEKAQAGCLHHERANRKRPKSGSPDLSQDRGVLVAYRLIPKRHNLTADLMSVVRAVGQQVAVVTATTNRSRSGE
jgi:hypothetical protein